MKIPFSNLKSERKLEYTILIAIALFVFKIIFPVSNTFILKTINEILVFAEFYFGFLYATDFIAPRKNSPLSIVLNSGILAAVIFFIVAVSSSLFDIEDVFSAVSNFITSILTTLLSFVFIGALIYIFSVFKELFFLQQKKDPQKYFNAMLIFMSAAFFASSIAKSNPEWNFANLTFYSVALVLISLNSLRVSWIAFLSKKQKLFLLIISIILSLLFGFNFGLTFDNSFINKVIINFSPGLHLCLNLVMIYGTIYFGVIFFTTLFHLPTAEAFDRKAAEASSLMDLSKLITQVFDFKELADTVTSVTTNVCNSDSAWLVTKSGSGTFELNSVKNIGFVDANTITECLLSEDSIDENQVTSITAEMIERKAKDQLIQSGLKAVVIAPLKAQGITNGFLFTGRKQNYNFDEDDLKSIEAFADYAAVAMENAKLLEQSIENERMESELNVAREIQKKLLPLSTPKFDNLEISALFIPALEVGGDYYDFFNLGSNKLGFVIADVSGKGIPAAFIMAEVKGVFESLARLISSPKELLIKANEILKQSLDSKNFVTAIYGIIDVEKGKLVFARAGHVPLLMCRDNHIQNLRPAGIGIALDDGRAFEPNLHEMEIELNNNDILTLFTDGITEAKNLSNEEFGSYRFEKIIKENCNSDLDKLSDKILSEITVFSKDKPQHDDITLILFKWNFNNKPAGVI
ncbi:MAG: SpoIIE family protein phosphatase [Bacteroidetes bacterium]|nr:SpoIIE family protein phosphatase [Bacteroidota bacterium]